MWRIDYYFGQMSLFTARQGLFVCYCKKWKAVRMRPQGDLGKQRLMPFDITH